jgi:hypothetical protein
MKIGRDRSVDRSSVRQLNDWLKNLDKDSQREIKRGIKAEIGSVTKQMTNHINAQRPMPPMSGFNSGGDWGWSGPVVKPSLRLSAGRGKPVAQITAQGKKSGMKKMFAIAERAGTRSAGYTPEGVNMIDVLDSRYPGSGDGGRFAWESWLEYRPELIDAVQSALDGLAKQYRRRGLRAVKGLFRG